MSPTTRVLLALAAGLAAGAAIAASGSPALLSVATAAEPLGTLWVNAIRMTVIPLVVSLLITGVVSVAEVRAVGRVGSRAVVLFVAVLGGVAALTVAVAPPLLARLAIPAGAGAQLRGQADAGAGAAAAAPGLPGLGDWLLGLVPVNPIRAAADGAMLPLVVFTLLFALAALRIAPELRRLLAQFFQATGEAMLVLVHWVLALAPLGVFALALPLGARGGASVTGALVYYVVVMCGVCLVVIGALYLLAATAGGVPIRRFARAGAAAQAVAFSSRSSLAALPAMVEGGRVHLALAPQVTGFFLPLAVSTFRPSATVSLLLGPLFLAHLYGVELGAGGLASLAVASVLLSFSVPGVPGGSILVMTPVLAGLGIPTAGVGILLAIDTVPDMFRTLLNVTAHLSAAAVLDRGAAKEERGSPSPHQPGAPPAGGVSTTRARKR